MLQQDLAAVRDRIAAMLDGLAAAADTPQPSVLASASASASAPNTTHAGAEHVNEGGVHSEGDWGGGREDAPPAMKPTVLSPLEEALATHSSPSGEKVSIVQDQTDSSSVQGNAALPAQIDPN